MRHTVLLPLLFALALPVTDASAIEPAHREIIITAGAGPLLMGGGWADAMEDGVEFRLDLGIALNEDLIVGFHSSSGLFDTISPTADDPDWEEQYRRYSSGMNVEYALGRGSLRPFVGGHVGVHGYRIGGTGYYSGVGDYDVGYGLGAGLRYRTHQRYGFLLRYEAEHTPDMVTGWVQRIQAGVSLHL